MMLFKSFEDIKAWQLAKEISADLYRLKCKTDYGIDIGFKDQIQRASVSIMSNIAEGFEYGNKNDFKRYLRIAKGSAGEVRSLLFIGRDISYITGIEFNNLYEKIVEVSKLLSGLIKSLD
jgi:four helix bundle protein